MILRNIVHFFQMNEKLMSFVNMLLRNCELNILFNKDFYVKIYFETGFMEFEWSEIIRGVF